MRAACATLSASTTAKPRASSSAPATFFPAHIGPVSPMTGWFLPAFQRDRSPSVPARERLARSPVALSRVVPVWSVDLSSPLSDRSPSALSRIVSASAVGMAPTMREVRSAASAAAVSASPGTDAVESLFPSPAGAFPRTAGFVSSPISSVALAVAGLSVAPRRRFAISGSLPNFCPTRR